MKRDLAKRPDLSGAAAMRAELARKIAAHAPTRGEQATAIPNLKLYRHNSISACNPTIVGPSVAVFVQGRKRVNL